LTLKITTDDTLPSPIEIEFDPMDNALENSDLVSATSRYFEDSGFIVLPDLLSESELIPVSNEIDDYLSAGSKTAPADAIVYEANSYPPRIRNIFHLHRFSPVCMNLAQHPKIISVVENILGSPLRLYSSSLFAKPAEVGTQVPLHQDMAYWPFEPYQLLSCWIALDDSTVENGCVRFLSKSHKLGLLHHVPSGVPGNSLGIDDNRITGLDEHAVEVRRGSCVLHHCLTAHRSEANRSARPRRGLIFVYMSPHVRLTDPSKIKGTPDFPVVRGGKG
jgi:ectoine hydroxylase-related dioxygenase (phytanoyl-CoA dioxygenase family)